MKGYVDNVKQETRVTENKSWKVRRAERIMLLVSSYYKVRNQEILSIMDETRQKGKILLRV